MTDSNVPTGIAWPFRFLNGRVATSSGELHIQQSVLQILSISKGEYLFRPTYGSNVRRRVFDPVNMSHVLAGDIAEAIRRMEPRVEVQDITVEIEQ